jgi:hypothetical protein
MAYAIVLDYFNLSEKYFTFRCLPEYLWLSAYTEFASPFADAFKEYDHGQDNQEQQGSKEAGSADTEGKEIGQGGEEACVGRGSPYSPLSAQSETAFRALPGRPFRIYSG